MATPLLADSTLATRVQLLIPCLRAGERVAVVYFLYLAVLSWVRPVWMGPRIVLPLLAAAICVLGAWEAGRSTATTRVVRDWLSMGLILAAYWSAGWFTGPGNAEWQERWVAWDRVVLNGWGLRAGIESLGIVLPSVLETVYLLLYAFPPVCVCLLYWVGGRDRVHRYLYTMLLGTLTVYALLPLLPVHGPHVVYPLADLPNVRGLGRGINVWILDHMDISTSVFPSGHVAVAFSSGLGMLAAVRERPWIWGGVMAAAVVVYVATVYCRYHYAVDGLASIAVVMAAWAVSRGGRIE